MNEREVKGRMNERELKGRKLIVAVVAIALSLSTVAIVAAQPVPPAPHKIFGYIFSGTNPCNDPSVNITNTNLSINWTAVTDTNYNYYELMLSAGQGYDVNVTHLLRFNATSPGGMQNKTENHTVNAGDIDDGGLFYFNITFPSTGMCGDVNDDGFILTDDAGAIFNVAGNIIPPSALANQWAADVNCDGFILTDDAGAVFNVAGNIIPASALNCCP